MIIKYIVIKTFKVKVPYLFGVASLPGKLGKTWNLRNLKKTLEKPGILNKNN